MITGEKLSLVNVFAGSPWEAALITGILAEACIHVSTKDEGKEIKLSVPSEHYSVAVRLISSRNN